MSWIKGTHHAKYGSEFDIEQFLEQFFNFFIDF